MKTNLLAGAAVMASAALSCLGAEAATVYSDDNVTFAGGVPNTCKSNGREELAPRVSGERVSNA